MIGTLRKGWCPGALRPMAAKDGLLVRLRLVGGILPAAAALALADLATRHGNGLFDLSARGNLQMRGVRDAALPALYDGLRALDLLDANAEAESVRNIIASPLAGLHAEPDIRPLVAALSQRLADDETLHALPAKFGFLIDDGSTPTLAGIDADVRFEWSGEEFAIGLAGTGESAVWIGVCGPDEVVKRAAEIAQVFLSLARGDPDLRRMRHLTAAVGIDAVTRACDVSPSPACGRRWPDEVGSDGGARRFSREHPAGGKSPHPTSADAEATFSRKREKDIARLIVGLHTIPEPDRDLSYLGLAAPFGRIDADMLRAAADLARTTPLDELRLTPWRVILIPGVDHLPALPGFIIDPDDPRLAVAACVGADGCARGSTQTQADAADLAALLPRGPGLTLHVSGCEKGCAKPSATPLTLVARNGRYDLVRDGRASDPPVRRGLDLAACRDLLRRSA